MSAVQDPVCHKCSPPGQPQVAMDLAFQCKVQGYDTYRFVCPSCGGIVNIQAAKAPNGESMVRQVALSGKDDEYRPDDAHKLDGARRLGRAGEWQVASQATYNRRFDLTGEITPAFSVARLSGLQGYGVPQPGGRQQAQAPTAEQQAAYMASMAQAQQYAAMMAAQGYRPVPGTIQQPVAFTLGQHPQAAQLDPNALRRRILGLPRRRV